MQICKFAFKDGKVHFQNKYVRTEAMMKEQAAGKMLYRGAFSVGNPSGGKFFNPFNFAVKGIANTGVLNWGNKLLALYEVSLHTPVWSPLKPIFGVGGKSKYRLAFNITAKLLARQRQHSATTYHS